MKDRDFERMQELHILQRENALDEEEVEEVEELEKLYERAEEDERFHSGK